jgi:prepilin-type N-terminal cleavage/methylation domain-containing protein
MIRDRAIGGFSLVEVMLAILILGVGLAGLTRGMTAALSSSKEGEVQTTAALLAAGQIETLRAEGLITTGETEGTCGEGLANYKWRQNINEADVNGLYEVTVTIENVKSGSTLYELKTLLFDPPIASTVAEGKGKKEKSRKREGKNR